MEDEVKRRRRGAPFGGYKSISPITGEPISVRQLRKEISDKIKTIKIPCKICGKEFLRTTPNSSFCSDECRAKEMKNQKMDWHSKTSKTTVSWLTDSEEWKIIKKLADKNCKTLAYVIKFMCKKYIREKYKNVPTR